ncbi:MAG: thioredoxin family protein [Pseudomonadota bacterium]
MRIEVIGLEPPCEKCSELLENAKKAAVEAGIEAEVVKLWVLSEEVRKKYGLPLSPALAIDGVLVAQGKVYGVERIVSLLKG